MLIDMWIKSEVLVGEQIHTHQCGKKRTNIKFINNVEEKVDEITTQRKMSPIKRRAG